MQRVNEDSTKAEASEFPRSRLDIVARLDGSRIEVALERSETTEYGKAERGSWEGMRMMGICLNGKPPLESLQVFEPVRRLMSARKWAGSPSSKAFTLS